jgi:uncharacterized protein (DUF849 family)
MPPGAPRRSATPSTASSRPTDVLIQAALNGGRSRAEHPALPQTPEELAADARACVDAGAELLHFHPRDERGGETLDAGCCANAIMAVRDACPGVPVVLSGGVWIARGDRKRQFEMIDAWIAKPDFVACVMAEPGAIDALEFLIDRGIPPEAGVVTVEQAETLAASGLGGKLGRILIEPVDPDPADAVATARAIDDVVATLGAPRLHHGYLGQTWAVIDAALARGLDVRVGFEDTLDLPDGTRASSNAELVAEVARRRDERRA